MTAAGSLEGSNLARACMLAGRNCAPAYVLKGVADGEITKDMLREVLLDAWSGAEFPCRCLPWRMWLALFNITGFVSDGAPKPTEPIEVYRAQVGRVWGLSWTRDAEKAAWFAARNRLFGLKVRVLHGFASPDAVLGIDDRRQESEVIADPVMMRRAAKAVA